MVRRASSTPQAYAYPLLIKQLLASSSIHSGTEIVYADKCRFDYRILHERIHRLGAALRSLGVEPGDTVAVMDWDSHRYLECYFAIPMLGAVLHTVNIRMAPQDVLYTVQHGAASTIIVHADFAEQFEAMRPQLNDIRHVIRIDDFGTPIPTLSTIEYEALLVATPALDEFPEFTEEAVATTFYTSGTTGKPKAVEFTHRQIVLHTLATLGAMASAPDAESFRLGDVYMPLTPMFHAHAWGFPYVSTLLGVKQVYPGKYDAGRILVLQEREAVTYSHGVPTVLKMIIDEAHATGRSLVGWRMTIGGSPLAAGLAAQAEAKGLHAFAGYGMSETGPNIAISHSHGGAVQPVMVSRSPLTCAGMPLPLVQIRVVDEDMLDLPHDGSGVGEIVVRSPWLTQSYRGNIEASEELWAGGWLHTGDVGSIAPNGSLILSDRLKDLIKSGGEWISSADLESLISENPAVAEVAVIAVDDPRWGERPMAVVVLASGYESYGAADSIKQKLLSHAADGRISRYAVPALAFRAGLPKTGTGKIDKKTLRATFLEQAS